MKLKLLTITCLIVGSLCAQNNFEGIVADIKTREPLPFVNIGIINKNPIKNETTNKSQNRFED